MIWRLSLYLEIYPKTDPCPQKRARSNCAGTEASYSTAHVESICPVREDNFLDCC